jgi:membrane-bound lytic murein transglycosylase D
MNTYIRSIATVILLLMAFPISSYAGPAFSLFLPVDSPALKQIPLEEKTSFSPESIANAINENSVKSPVFLSTADVNQPAIKALYETYGYNYAVQQNLRDFSKFKNSFSKRLMRSGKYVTQMSDILVNNGLPPELVYLPLIESEFRTDAYSHKKASGPWQIMPRTAKILGLKIDWWIDERRDPEKSTRVAAKYLNYLYKKFGSWNLALAAYNAGEGRIRMALKSSGTTSYWEIRETRYIAGETKNYVPLYIAAAAIAMDPEGFGFKKLEYQRPLEYDEVVINQPMSIDMIARFTGVDERIIKDLNPELRRWCTPPDVAEYKLRIPKSAKKMFMASVNNTVVQDLMNIRFYKVERGDTVAKIAKKLGASIQRIINMNGLGSSAMIFAGKQIVIPPERNLTL